MKTNEDIEETLVLIKPDAVRDGHACAIIQELLSCSALMRSRTVMPSDTLLQAHLAHLDSAAIRKRVVTFMSAPVVALHLAGPAVIARVRDLIGATDPAQAEPSSIRARFSGDSLEAAIEEDRALQNCVHASDSPGTARRELELWFDPALSDDHLLSEDIMSLLSEQTAG